MDVREKLVELLQSAPADITGNHGVGALADHLIANGVTVQEWISVKEQLPQENEPEGVLCEDVQVLLNNGKVSVGWCKRRTKVWWQLNYGGTDCTGCGDEDTPVIAWKPLAQAPEGE